MIINEGGWVEIRLPNHPREDYQDILDAHPEPFPDVWVYRADVPYTVLETERAQSDAEGYAGMEAEALIDISKRYAVVRLNADLYAETPPEGLTEEAERALLEWASDFRDRLTRQGAKEVEGGQDVDYGSP